MRWKHQLVFPVCTSKITDLEICLLTSCTNVSDFMIVPAVFYVVVAAARLDLGALRKDGWLFDMAEGAGGGEDRWYEFYSYLGEKNFPRVKGLISY